MDARPRPLQGLVNLYVIAAVAVICLICLAIIARNWSCRQRRQPRPPVTHTVVGKVASVDAANLITLDISQRARRQVIRQVVIAHVAISGSDGKDLTAKLLPIGSSATVSYQGRRRIFGDAADPSDQFECDNPNVYEGISAREPIVGTVTGESGADVGLELLKAGLATCSSDAPDEYKAAEKAAKKRK